MSTRDSLIDLLRRDLVGPQSGPNELIVARPSDQYVTGILYPQPGDDNQTVIAEQDDDRDAVDDEEGSPGDAIAMATLRRPNMIGLSFAITGDEARIHVSGSAGRYLRRWRRSDGTLAESDPGDARLEWQRKDVPLEKELTIREGLHPWDAGGGLHWWVRALRIPVDGTSTWQVTVALTNDNVSGKDRNLNEEVTFFQVGFSVKVAQPAQFAPRITRQAHTDDDALSNAVIYRNAREWAVGHTCAATWDDGEQVNEVSTTWLPRQLVRAMSPAGHRYFVEESRRLTGDDRAAFDAAVLAAAAPDQLVRILEAVPAAYARWLVEQDATVSSLESAGVLPPDVARTAHDHVNVGHGVVERMQAGIKLLRDDASARLAFQLAQRAMCIQRRWARRDDPAMVWRPFQLGFQLLCIESIANPLSNGEVTSARCTMDLLWFPTGGGKTEAYLGLTAFTLFHRRLRNGKRPDDGAGVAVLMRYTLRLLTVQQFERTARLVLACEFLRRSGKEGDKRFGVTPFSIGLWVGNSATPGTLKDAVTSEGRRRARQLARCPACNEDKHFHWDITATQSTVRCQGPGCDLRGFPRMGVWTIDEEIYKERPSVVIGTIDKFAQVVRKADTAALLGSDRGLPPDLIIQDELHLISGPLGTVAGLYEAAIDLICTRNGLPPKVIGSTATIRRASDQVRQLFDRKVLQFPPPILDSEDSCFAVVDDEAPGRVYVGVTSAGRSPKFTLQAVCASLMQGADELPVSDRERDPYWTLVAYFNSLRELGGALVMMRDDVEDSIVNYAQQHGARPRSTGDTPIELTSRVEQSEIPNYLVALEDKYPNQPINTVLATNMISVGVDIPRLGLMVVNGQPKGMAEYIQATSRVGRGTVAGLVVTVYNVGRPRDRSHYEAFRTWHQTLYREVEATSVTPFAPRARDRALHGAIVALARHGVPALRDNPRLDAASRNALLVLVDKLIARVRNVDPTEADEVRREASAFLDEWEARGPVEAYWDDYRPSRSLLVSLEAVVTARAAEGAWRYAARGTPNSMRNVEPETTLRMTDVLAAKPETAS